MGDVNFWARGEGAECEFTDPHKISQRLAMIVRDRLMESDTSTPASLEIVSTQLQHLDVNGRDLVEELTTERGNIPRSIISSSSSMTTIGGCLRGAMVS